MVEKKARMVVLRGLATIDDQEYDFVYGHCLAWLSMICSVLNLAPPTLHEALLRRRSGVMRALHSLLLRHGRIARLDRAAPQAPCAAPTPPRRVRFRPRHRAVALSGRGGSASCSRRKGASLLFLYKRGHSIASDHGHHVCGWFRGLVLWVCLVFTFHVYW